MAKVFQKLRRILMQLQGRTDSAAEIPYEVTCECGEPVRGIRRQTWIEAECQSCYQSVFVLPANVYPTTRSVPSEVLGGSFSERLRMVVRELFPRKESTAVETPAKAGAKPARKEAKPDAADTPPVRKKLLPTFRLPRIDVRGFLVRTFTPFRLLMISIVAVVGLTMYWMTWQQQVEAARQTWVSSSEKIEQLLSDANTTELEQALEKAVDAGRVLGKQDPEWRRTLNLLQETAAVNSLSSSALLTGFFEAYDAKGKLKSNAEDRIRTLAESGSFVFDSYVLAGDDKKGIFRFEFPAAPGRHPIDIQLAMPQLAQVLEKTEDRRILFSAEIESVVGPGSGGRWKLTIDPDSFVLLTSSELCSYMGLTEEHDAQLPVTLQRQKEFVESSASWEFRADDVVPAGEEKTAARHDEEREAL